MIDITVNGRSLQLSEPATLSEFLERQNIQPRLIAIDRNGAVVPRSEYASVTLESGDVLEIVQMVGGG